LGLARRLDRDGASRPVARDDHPIATLRLGLVDGLVCGMEEVLARCAVYREGRDAQGDRDGGWRRSIPGTHGSVEMLEGALSTGMVAGGLETWDRLAALLAEG
jgi:hypothetical protein